MKQRFVLPVVLLIGVLLSSCTTSTPAANDDLQKELKIKEDLIVTLSSEKETLMEEVSVLKRQLNIRQDNSILNTALVVVELLKEQDMAGLSSYVHPTQGVRFTPYAYVDLQTDQVFTQQDIETLLQSSQIYTWGVYDGIGDPIELSFKDYLDMFIYDVDFANPHMIGNNVEIGTGNSINNVSQAYPNAAFIEFHFTGFDPQFAGIDWRSLRLVFEDVSGTWYLVGIVHDQWTI